MQYRVARDAFGTGALIERLNTLEDDDEAALHKLAEDNVWQPIQLMHTYGANLDLVDFRGSTALMRAANVGNPDTVRTLLELGVDVDAFDPEYERTALHLAVDYANVQCIKLLLDAGANPQLRDMDGNTARDVLKYSRQYELEEEKQAVSLLLTSAVRGDAAARRDERPPTLHRQRSSR